MSITGMIQFFGQIGDDSANGGLRDDSVFGNSSNDVLSDPSGSNTLNGGAGSDLIVGFAGQDSITSNDGFADTVNGGPDVYTCTTDAADTVFNCE